MAALRKWLLAGLLVLVPLMITIAVINWVVSTLDKTLEILPAEWQPELLIGFYIPGFGVVLALAIVLVIGAATSNFIGNKLVTWWDRLLNRIPVVRSVYSAVKQVSDTLFSEKSNAFREALLVQWPREGVWTSCVFDRQARQFGVDPPRRRACVGLCTHNAKPYQRLLDDSS